MKHITPEMNLHNCQLCQSEYLGRCLGEHYGIDVSENNEPCTHYKFAGSLERLKEIEGESLKND